MSKTKLEKVLELVINEETEKAADLLHDIFVEKSRAIYADMIEEDVSIDDDLEESLDDSDFSDDFERDITDSDNEIKAEEYFGEDDELEDDDFDSEDEAEFELGDEMAGDMDGDMDMGADEFAADDIGGEMDAPDAEEAMMNVEDALEELKAAFADMVGDDGMSDEIGDEYADDEIGADDDLEAGDEFATDDLEAGDEFDAEDEFAESEEVDEDALEEESVDEDEALEEGATLSTVTAKMPDGTDTSAKSPVGPGDKTLGKGKPVNAKGGDEKGPSAAKTTQMSGFDGPQEAGKGKNRGRLKKVTGGAAKGTKGSQG